MNARISYFISKSPHPWDAKYRVERGELFVLWKQTRPASGQGMVDAVAMTQEPIAIFNLDPEAQLFEAELQRLKALDEPVPVEAKLSPWRRLVAKIRRFIHFAGN